MRSNGFTTTFVVPGEVSNGVDSVKDVRTELIYSKSGHIPARGIFYGNEEISRKLLRILLSGKASFRGFWSSSSATYNLTFHVRKIHFDRYQGRYETDKLCEFNCGELDVETNYHLSNKHTDKVDTLLIRYAIPNRRELLLPKFPEQWKKDLPKYKDWLEYETTLGTMKIGSWTYSRTMTVESKHGLFSFDESALSFDIPVQDRNLDEVLAESERVVEEYLKLISFILQCETKYYKQEVSYLNSERMELKNRLRLVQRAEVKPTQRPILFEWHTVDEMLKELIPKFSTHVNKEEIEESILLFLAAIHSEFAEARLVLMHSAIETIVNTLKDSLSLSKAHCSTCHSDLITLRERILQVISPLNVQIDDIYPSVLSDGPKTFPFIKYRNDLAHGRRREIDYKDLPSELYRQQLILERLILHWIGFDARRVDYLKLWEGVNPY